MIWHIRQLCTLWFVAALVSTSLAKGSLFIIGGGKRSEAMIKRLIAEANVANQGYIYILPMASEEQDSSLYYAALQFKKLGFTQLAGRVVDTLTALPQSVLDSIAQTPLVYIPGGDQVKFMKIADKTGISTAIRKAHKQGAVVAGTSAGAAAMSALMITGVELKHQNTTEASEKEGFTTIEADNMEISRGLGLLPEAIIDQHFVKRKRLNRLFAVSMEHPGTPCIGIDEATAILVKGNRVEVVGDSQVVVLMSKGGKSNPKFLLSCPEIKASVHVPGDVFNLK